MMTVERDICNKNLFITFDPAPKEYGFKSYIVSLFQVGTSGQINMTIIFDEVSHLEYMYINNLLGSILCQMHSVS